MIDNCKMSYRVPSNNKMLIPNSKIEYDDMRRRLLETEQKLRNLSRFEEEVQSVTSVTISSFTDQRTKNFTLSEPLHSGNEAYPSRSVTSDSYCPFGELKVPAVARNNSKKMVTPSKDDSFESDSSYGSVCKIAPTNRYERKLLSQNERLLSEVERLVDEIHALKQKTASFIKYEALAKRLPDLEDKIDGLLAENKAQDNALREAEKNIEESDKLNAELQMRIEKLEDELLELRMESDTIKTINKEIECQRDEALQNLMEAQKMLENYQRCMLDKIRKMEALETELRENLTNTTQERDEFSDHLNDMQMSLTSQEAQINRLLNDLEMEESKKQEVEKERNKLLEQLGRLTEQINRYENESKDIKVVKKEKQLLEAELTEHRSMAQEIAELLMIVQHNHNKNVLDDVSNCATRNANNEIKIWQDKKPATVAELNVNNNGNSEQNINNNGLGCEGNVTMMGELRNLFVNMDGEIQRLRYDLKQRDADDKTYQNLHDELKVLMERVESGVTANQELSCQASSLEEEKRSLLIKINECQQTVAERERQIQLLDTRLNERNHQVICLQEDNNEKSETICNLRKQVEHLEQLLQGGDADRNQMREQLEAALSKIKELEELLCQKEMTIHDLNEQIVKLQKECRAIQQKLEKKVDCLNQQVYEYEKQTEQLSAENENLRGKLGNCLKSCEDCRRLLQIQENQNLALESQIEELKTMLEEKEKLHCKLLESYQQKICKANEQIKNLENALVMCRNEVKMHMETMEKIKNHFECEILKRDACIKHLKEELRKCSEDLKCRANENCLLEQTNADLQNKLSNTYAQLKCCEQNGNLLSEKLKNTENIMLKDKACYMKENEEMERRLTQALNSLQCSHEEINKLKSALSEKSGMVDCLQGEKNSLCRDLAKCKEVACTLQDKLNKMEKDNQELCRQLQQKMDCIRDMEVTICNKDQEVKRCQRCLEELQEKIKRMQADQCGCQLQLACLQEKLKCCREELYETGKRLSETEDALKRCQSEVEDKCEIIRSLNCTLEELSCRLHERNARVDELEKAIENLNKDIEKRMKRVDEQLKKYECELCDKAKQIADIDDCLSRCQHNLSEKCNEVCVLDQKNARLISDLCACNAKLKESEDARECLGKALAEQRAETAEVSQELRSTRDQLQQKQQELMDCQQSLCCSNREWDKCRREADELRSTLSQREMELVHLNEEKNCLVSKVAHLTCRLESEICQLENQQAEMKCRLEKENEALRIYQTELEENNACLVQKLGTCQRQLSQVEKCCTQKMDCMNREIADLISKVADRDDQITQCKDCVAIRDSEIMRLKLKLCNTDTICGGNLTCNNSNCTDTGYGYSADNRFEPDDIGNPILLTSSHLQEWIQLPSCQNSSGVISDGQTGMGSSQGKVDPASINSCIGKKLLHLSPGVTKEDITDSGTSNSRNIMGESRIKEHLQEHQTNQEEVKKSATSQMTRESSFLSNISEGKE